MINDRSFYYRLIYPLWISDPDLIMGVMEMKKEYEITQGSIADLMQRDNVSLAESFLSCDCIILFDVSGSMASKDGTGISRFNRGIKELKDLQSSMPGKVAVVQFADHPDFLPGGVPTIPCGGTDLTAALKYIKIADEIPDLRIIIISDGEPNNELTALAEASKFNNRIDTIFIGDETEPEGKTFLRDLASRSGGSPLTSAAENISKDVTYLLSERVGRL